MNIYFDFDGTIVNVSDRFYTVYQCICRELGVAVLNQVDYWLARCTRKSTREILRLSAGEGSYEAFIEKRTRLIESQQFLVLDQLRVGAKWVLKRLAQRHRLVLVSARGSHHCLTWQLKTLNIYDFFSEVCVSPPFGTWRDKAAILTAQQALSHGDAMIVGDTESDILAGQSVGITTCAVNGGMALENDLRRLEPGYVIHELSSLLDIVPCAAQGSRSPASL